MNKRLKEITAEKEVFKRKLAQSRAIIALLINQKTKLDAQVVAARAFLDDTELMHNWERKTRGTRKNNSRRSH